MELSENMQELRVQVRESMQESHIYTAPLTGFLSDISDLWPSPHLGYLGMSSLALGFHQFMADCEHVCIHHVGLAQMALGDRLLMIDALEKHYQQ
jgi:hypothetical protein